MVATGSGDSTLRLWSLEDGAALRTFQGHGASVLRVSFLAGGLQVRQPWHFGCIVDTTCK